MKENYFFLLFITFILIFAIRSEYKDRNLLKESPHCNYVTNYCNSSSKLNNVKMILFKPEKDKKIDVYFNKLLDKFKFNGVVFWRMSLIFSIIMILFYYFYNQLSNNKLPMSNYYFLFILNWFSIYFILNHFNFHYIDKNKTDVKFIIEAIKTNIKEINKK